MKGKFPSSEVKPPTSKMFLRVFASIGSLEQYHVTVGSTNKLASLMESLTSHSSGFLQFDSSIFLVV